MDIVLLTLLAAGFVSGAVSGAVRQLVSLAAFVLGFALACRYYVPLADVLASAIAAPALCRGVAFAALLVVVPVAGRLVGSMLTSVMDGLLGLGLLNRLLGGLFGMARFALVLGAAVWFLSSVRLIGEEALQTSRLACPLKAVPQYIYKVVMCQKEPDAALSAPHGEDGERGRGISA